MVLGGAMPGCPRGAPAHTGAMVMLLAASPGARGCPLMGIGGGGDPPISPNIPPHGQLTSAGPTSVWGDEGPWGCPAPSPRGLQGHGDPPRPQQWRTQCRRGRAPLSGVFGLLGWSTGVCALICSPPVLGWGIGGGAGAPTPSPYPMLGPGPKPFPKPPLPTLALSWGTLPCPSVGTGCHRLLPIPIPPPSGAHSPSCARRWGLLPTPPPSRDVRPVPVPGGCRALPLTQALQLPGRESPAPQRRGGKEGSLPRVVSGLMWGEGCLPQGARPEPPSCRGWRC